MLSCSFLIHPVVFTQAQLFKGSLPEPSSPSPYGDKLHQQFQRCRAGLEHILAGYGSLLLCWDVHGCEPWSHVRVIVVVGGQPSSGLGVSLAGGVLRCHVVL